MPKGVSETYTGRARSKAAKKGARHRTGKSRGPYGMKVLPAEVSERMRAIAARVGGGAPLPEPAERLATPGECAARIDAVLGALDREGNVPRDVSRGTSEAAE